MIPWETIEEGAPGETLSLLRRGDEWSIRTRGFELMNSHRFGSERALAELAAAAVTKRDGARVLVGGLGMGYTLAAALESFPGATISVAEISPSVVAWNQRWLGPLAGHPLQDVRSQLVMGDVAELLHTTADGPEPSRFDAILLDVDNGPEAISHASNDSLYSPHGIEVALAALKSGGVLGIWAAGPHAAFERRARKAGVKVSAHRVAQWKGAGRRHVVWILEPVV